MDTDNSEIIGQGSFGVVYKFNKCFNNTWYNGLQLQKVFEISTKEFLTKEQLCEEKYQKYFQNSIIKIQKDESGANTEYVFNHTFSSLERASGLFVKLYLALQFTNNDGENYVGYVFEKGEPLSLLNVHTQFFNSMVGVFEGQVGIDEMHVQKEQFTNLCENLIFNLDNIFKSIKFLVKNNKTHNDIKPDNMIYSVYDDKVKFIDLGSVTSVSDIGVEGIATTPMYASIPVMTIIGKTTTMYPGLFDQNAGACMKYAKTFFSSQKYQNNNDRTKIWELDGLVSGLENGDLKEIYKRFIPFSDLSQIGFSIVDCIMKIITVLEILSDLMGKKPYYLIPDKLQQDIVVKKPVQNIKQQIKTNSGNYAGTFVVHDSTLNKDIQVQGEIQQYNGTFVIHGTSKDGKYSTYSVQQKQTTPQGQIKYVAEKIQQYSSDGKLSQNTHLTNTIRPLLSVPLQKSFQERSVLMRRSIMNSEVDQLNIQNLVCDGSRVENLKNLLYVILNIDNYIEKSSDNGPVNYDHVQEVYNAFKKFRNCYKVKSQEQPILGNKYNLEQLGLDFVSFYPQKYLYNCKQQ